MGLQAGGYPISHEVICTELMWYFVLYSFAGCLLERFYAWLTRAKQRRRRCFRVLPLCPVYGLGALAILAVTRWTQLTGLWLLAACAVAASGVEYLMAVVYERGFGVTFWNYAGLRGNLQGRVCPAFSAVWGVLAVVLTGWVHPAVQRLVDAIPMPITVLMVLLLAADSLHTAAVLYRKRTIDSLCWPQFTRKNTA